MGSKQRMHSPEMLGKTEEEILTRELLRVDASFRSILYVAGFAATYRHSSEWDKLNVEGTFVLYSRRKQPAISIHVFSKKSLKDFSLGISEDMQVGLQDGLITLQSTGDSDVYGLWFHSSSHPVRILECLKANL